MSAISSKNKSKPNHNRSSCIVYPKHNVCNIFKEQIETKSQLVITDEYRMVKCLQYLQRTNRNQITTYDCFVRFRKQNVCNIFKEQIETKSQPCVCTYHESAKCLQYLQRTNRNQITTLTNYLLFVKVMSAISSKNKSKPNHNYIMLYRI